MKKRKFAALTVASMIAIGILAGCSTGSSSSAAAQSSSVTAESQAAVQELEVLDNFGDVSAADAEYEPQVGYDKYTVVDYYLEAADTDLMITCSAKADDSEYCMEFNFYGDDQMVVCDHEGHVLSDKTGFMGNDAPVILAYIQENAVWSAMPQ